MLALLAMILTAAKLPEPPTIRYDAPTDAKKRTLENFEFSRWRSVGRSTRRPTR